MLASDFNTTPMQLHKDERPARTTRAAVIASLYDVPGKAEIVHGTIVRMSGASASHGRATLTIASSLREHALRIGYGIAFGDNVTFLVNLPNRWSFCPDAAFHVGPDTGSEFLDRAPVFAVEIRSKSEYSKAAERRMAAKRAEYFAAGTLVVWDVDLFRDGVVRAFNASAPNQSVVCPRGETASAEPAVPGWALAVDDLFVSQPEH
jgi:Uma2 family endonuclease